MFLDFFKVSILLLAFSILCFIKKVIEQYLKTLSKLLKLDSQSYSSLDEVDNKCIYMAKKIYNKFNIIYSSSNMEVLGLRFRAQLAENAKILSSHYIFPEQNHNEIEAFENLHIGDINIIWIKDKSDHKMILKRMKRRHSRKQVINFCKEVKKRRNDVVFGADIIAGFPTETEEMFIDTIDLINECNITHLHIFTYSPRKSTAAARIPQLPKDVIKNRAKKLRDIGKQNLSLYLEQQIGNNTTMLVEQSNLTMSMGKSQHFTKMQIKQKLPVGSIVNCKIQGVYENILQAV